METKRIPHLRLIDLSQRYLFSDPDPSSLRTLLEGPGIVGIRSPMGTGKTEAMKFLTRDRPLIAIAHRVALVRNLARRLDCLYYRDPDRTLDDLGQAERLAICLDSAWKCKQQDAGVIVIDEAAQVLETLLRKKMDETGTRRIEVFNALRRISRSARVILLDAHLEPWHLRLWSMILGTREWGEDLPAPSFTYLRNTPQMTRGRAFQYCHKGLLVAQAERLLEQGEKVYISCDVKKTAEKIAAVLASDLNGDHLLVTADTRRRKKEREWLADPTTGSEKYRLIVVSPAVSTGVSIDHPGFKHVFHLAEKRLISVYEQVQMLSRCRRAETLHLLLKHPVEEITKWTPNAQQMEDLLAEPLRTTHRYLEAHGQQVPVLDAYQQVMLKAGARLASERTRMSRYYAQFVEELLREDGWTIQTADTDHLSPIKLPRSTRKEKVQRIVTAKALSASEYLDVQERGEETAEHQYGYVKGQLEGFYPVDDRRDITFWANYDPDLKKIAGIGQLTEISSGFTRSLRHDQAQLLSHVAHVDFSARALRIQLIREALDTAGLLARLLDGEVVDLEYEGREHRRFNDWLLAKQGIAKQVIGIATSWNREKFTPLNKIVNMLGGQVTKLKRQGKVVGKKYSLQLALEVLAHRGITDVTMDATFEVAKRAAGPVQRLTVVIDREATEDLMDRVEAREARDQLEDLLKRTDEDGVLVEDYWLGRKASISGTRLYTRSRGSIQGLPSRFRPFVVAGDFFDVDLVNAHPTLLNEETNERYPALNAYCSYRDAVLAKVAREEGWTRSRAKEAMRIALFDPFRDWNGTLKSFAEDCAAAGAEVLGGVYDASSLQFHLSKVEQRIVGALHRHHQARGDQILCLLHDGYFVRAEDLEAADLDRVINQLGFTTVRTKVRAKNDLIAAASIARPPMLRISNLHRQPA